MRLEELLSRYAAGERDFSGIEVKLSSTLSEQVKEWYFSGVDLSGANFRDSDLQALVFWGQGLNLSGADRERSRSELRPSGRC